MSKTLSLALVVVTITACSLAAYYQFKWEACRRANLSLAEMVVDPMVEAAYDPPSGDVMVRLHERDDMTWFFPKLCPSQMTL